MCTIPPPPPVPPPAPFQSLHGLTSLRNKIIKRNLIPSDSETCIWAVHETPLWEVCTKNNICLHEIPHQFRYKHFEPILQVGPTCGLVALSMLVNGEVTTDVMLSTAKSEGYSNNGEMFSCPDMIKLAKKILSLSEAENIKCFLKKGDLFSHKTIDKLMNGAVLLVPYDADFNHAPCLKQGHKAHWALICGVILIKDPGDSYISDPNNVYVLCRHGKSQYLAAWKLVELAESNSNLWEFSPKREDDGLIYVLPEGGIGGDMGLRDQYLLFEAV